MRTTRDHVTSAPPPTEVCTVMRLPRAAANAGYNEPRPQMTRRARRLGFVVFPLFLAMTGLGQRFRFREEEEGPRPVFPTQAEFHFIRVEYTDLPENHRF